MRSLLLISLLVSSIGCGDNERPALSYTNPKGGALRLVKSKTAPAAESEVVLDLVVGDQPVTGFSVGFDLPVGHGRVRLADMTPGTALDPGTSPVAAVGTQPSRGPLTDVVVTGLSQKASGTGAVATDTVLAPGAVLYTIRIAMLSGAPDGVVVDGTAADFHLPSGGMRDRGGTTVVEAKDVAIGKLEVNR